MSVHIRKLFPNASQSFYENNLGVELQSTESERDKEETLGAAVQGKTKSIPPIVVRFIGYRVRPLDPDNFAGGAKDLLDGLRHSGLIPGDEPWKIDFQTTQEKVHFKRNERTIIEIEYPE